jgi:hypothetical protein
MPSPAMQDAIDVIRDKAAEATERIGKFLRARVPSPDSSERQSSDAS